MPTKRGARQRVVEFARTMSWTELMLIEFGKRLDALEAEARDREDVAFLRELNRLAGQGYLKAWLRRRRERRRK